MIAGCGGVGTEGSKREIKQKHKVTSSHHSTHWYLEKMTTTKNRKGKKILILESTTAPTQNLYKIATKFKTKSRKDIKKKYISMQVSGILRNSPKMANQEKVSGKPRGSKQMALAWSLEYKTSWASLTLQPNSPEWQRGTTKPGSWQTGHLCRKQEWEKPGGGGNVAADPNLLKESKCQILMQKSWGLRLLSEF